jgi:hypothetical protein
LFIGYVRELTVCVSDIIDLTANDVEIDLGLANGGFGGVYSYVSAATEAESYLAGIDISAPGRRFMTVKVDYS